MKTKWMVMTLAAGALAFSGAAMAGDAAAGEKKADACIDCHEPAEFAGQKADAIAASIKAQLAATSKHKPKLTLSDADIADLAAYFATAK